MPKRSNRIILDNEYYIEADPLNWILKKRRKSLKSQDKVLGYYSNLEDALYAYEEKMTKKACLDYDMEIYIRKAIKLLGDIKNLVKSLAITLDFKIKKDS